MSTSKLSPKLILAGFLSFNCLMLASTIVGSIVLIGGLLRPRIIGLYVTLPYYTFVLWISGRPECKDGNHWPSFSRNFILFRAIRAYLQLELVSCEKLLEADKKPNDAQFIFVVGPHGTNCDFRIVMDGLLYHVIPKTASRTRTLAASILFRLPLVRELALWTGCIDASRAVADRALGKGLSILLFPGGQAEQIRTVYGREMVYLSGRKGFLKLALKHQVPVVPVYVFGVTDYYKTWSLALSFRIWLLKATGAAIPISWGLWGLPTCPRPVPTKVVFGEPLMLPSCKDLKNPTNAEIDHAHQLYCTALRDLFNKNKGIFGYEQRELEIV